MMKNKQGEDMFSITDGFSSFSVNNIKETEDFYNGILGFKTSHVPGMEEVLNIVYGDSGKTMAYRKPDHMPATHTILNFLVNNLIESVKELNKRGVSFEKYTGAIQTDEMGISSNEGTKIAWFKDPSGNILSLIENRQ
jgi:predicted enzyme related to lactoylglutathione lyase